MKQLPHQLVRFFLLTLLAIALACCLVYLLQLAGAISPYLIAVFAAMIGAVLLALAGRTQGDQGLQQFADTVGRAIDAIMIGAAETSYFVDSVKKKVDLDVQTASDIADSSEQNARTTEKIAANAERAAKVAAGVREESVAARAELDQGLQRVNRAREDAQSASTAMLSLQEKSKRITGFTEAISDISARTNLLALNAAIEAARAGESGRGFAVVADEVRALAHRTQQSTLEIDKMVTTMRSGSSEALESMSISRTRATETLGLAQGAGESLNRITTSINEISERNLVIASAAEEQAQVAREVDRNIVNIRDLSMQSSSGANQISASSNELSRLAAELNQVVTRFRV